MNENIQVIYEVNETKEHISGIGDTIESANSMLITSLIERFRGEVPAGKILGTVPWANQQHLSVSQSAEQ